MFVDVENIGRLEFPDNTDPAVIQQTVKRLVSEKNERPREGGTLGQFKRIGEIYSEEEQAGREAMNKAVTEPTGRNIIGGFLGALQWGFSPLTAVVKGSVREPVEGGLKDIGVPKGAAEFVGEMAESGAYLIPYGKAVQTAVLGKKALEETKTIAKIAQELPKQPLKFPEKLPQEAIAEATKPVSEASNKVLKPSVVNDVVSELKKPIGEKWIPIERKRITQEVVDYITENPGEIEKAAEKYKLSPQDMAAQMKETMTLAGQDLQRMSQLAKDIRRKFQTDYMKKLSAFMESEIADVPAVDKFGKAFRTVENVRRSALVSQFATTVRNVISQGGRVALGSLDDAFQGAANAVLKSAGETPMSSIKSTLRGLGDGLDLFTAGLNRLNPKARQKIVDILNTTNAIDAKAKLFGSPIQDVMLTGKISKTLNTFNTMQEFFFRNIAFEAKLKQLSRNAGIDFAKVGAKDIPESMLMEAANYALEMTFAALPKSDFAKTWVRGMSHPIMTSLVNPFPRFLYGNALPFLKNFSPLGFLEALKPSVVADIVSGHPERFTKAISQATIGTIMLNTAAYIRNSKYAGEKWNEIKWGDKNVNMMAFAPLTTWLFIAEAMTHPEKIRGSDFGMALLSLNRIGGTGLVLADMMRGNNAATIVNPLKRLLGSYLSGFTVPARTLKDIYSAIDPEEATYRDIRENEFWGPSISNIPKVSQSLPKTRSPLRVGDIRAESPLLRQFTGLSTRTKNALEKEVDTVQLNYQRIYPKTGNAEADRKVCEAMAPVLEQAFPLLKSKTNYDQFDDITKRIILSELFRDAKQYAKAELMKTDPELAMKIKVEALSDDVLALLKKRGIIPGG
jgi:hypothetical protein